MQAFAPSPRPSPPRSLSERKFERIAGGAQLFWNVTIEREGAAKPAMIAETVSRRYV